MVQVMIVYDSPTGFTEKMAKAVVEGVQNVKDVDIELLKIGKPFSLSSLKEADALIFGSPNIYHTVTSSMERFLESMKDYLKLTGKIGGAFGSYGWNRGQVVEKLCKYMDSFGMVLAAPPLSIAHKTVAEPYIDEESLQKCRDLGEAIARKALEKPAMPPKTSEEQEIQRLEDQIKAIQQQVDQIKSKLSAH